MILESLVVFAVYCIGNFLGFRNGMKCLRQKFDARGWDTSFLDRE